MAVGVTSVEHLGELQRPRLREQGGRATVFTRTRNFPRRAEALLEGGSLYWIIRGAILVRQAVLALDAVTDEEGKAACQITLDARLVRTAPAPRRPMQGWRYLDPEQAPADLDHGKDSDQEAGLPPELARELDALGVR